MLQEKPSEKPVSSSSVNTVKTGNGNAIEELQRQRARIEQQSELISLMKKRNDGLLGELDVLYASIAKLNEEKDDWKCQLSAKQTQLDDQEKQLCILKETSEKLTSTNDCLLQEIEMLKCQSETLLKEKVSVLDENKMLIGKIECLQTKIGILSGENESIKKGIEITSHAAKSTLHEVSTKYQATLTLNSHLQLQINKLECQIAVNIQNLQEVKSEHAVQINDLHKQLAAIKLEASKWKHTTLELEKNILSLQKSDVSVTPEKKSKNIEGEEIKKLNEKIASLEKEFSTYKKHSMELLQHERELNLKLRHFTI